MRPAECAFAYRTSVFKRNDRHVVLGGDVPAAAVASVGAGALRRTGPHPRRRRRARGRRWPPSARPCWPCGPARGWCSTRPTRTRTRPGPFFMNPVLDPAGFAALRRAGPGGQRSRAAGLPAPSGLIKFSAAWLIERAGFHKGYTGGRTGVGISSKHTLALTNRGTAPPPSCSDWPARSATASARSSRSTAPRARAGQLRTLTSTPFPR